MMMHDTSCRSMHTHSIYCFNHAKMLRLSFAKGNKHTNKTKYIKILENIECQNKLIYVSVISKIQ